MTLKVQIVSTIERVPKQAWDTCAGGHPFVQHAFLKALESSGALGANRGVLPRYVLLTDSIHGLVACAPAMLKWGSLREFGPEIRWLKAGLEAGCFAWPKFQVGLPFFPVMGPKLLVRPDLAASPLRAAFIKALRRLGQREDGKSVCNVLHIDETTARFFQTQGALVTGEWHSMWTNTGFMTMPEYLASLSKRKRYQFRKDRREAESHGLAFRVLRGRELTDDILSDYYEGHRRVCERYGGSPWLPASTYAAIVEGFSGDAMLMGYFDGHSFVAGSMNLQSAAEQAIYMLQWSEMEKLQEVAVDLICQRPIEYALEHGIRKLDSGLAAPHKQYRGWRNTPVYHAHWFHNEELKALAQRYLNRNAR